MCLRKTDIIHIQCRLREKCWCHLPTAEITNLRQNFLALWVEDILSVTNSNRDHVLSIVSTIQLTCEFFKQQYYSDALCSKIASVYDSLKIHHKSSTIHLIKVLGNESSDQFVCFVVSRALSSLILLAGGEVFRTSLEMLIRSLVISGDKNDNMKLTSEYLRKLTYSLEVVRRIADWTELTNGECFKSISASKCAVIERLKLCESETEDSIDGCQMRCIETLSDKWPAIVNRFYSLLLQYDESYKCVLASFISLWQSIIAISGNSNYAKPFYSMLKRFLSFLSVNIPSFLLELTLDLFNESLCYGSNLALRDVLDDDPCSIAVHVVDNVSKMKKEVILNKVSYVRGNGQFMGGDGAGNKPLLQKTTLLILKSVAVVSKKLRCNYFNNCSYRSGAENQIKTTARKLKRVVWHLDYVVKEFEHITPQTNLASWIVSLFQDQDDYLIEGMLCCLDASVALDCCLQERKLAPDVFRDVQSIGTLLNPSESFLNFFKSVGNSPEMILDFLISSETCFLLYFHNLLKYHVIRCWPEFTSTCGGDLEDVMDTFNHLRGTISNLERKKLFPYQIRPVLKNLSICKELYEM